MARIAAKCQNHSGRSEGAFAGGHELKKTLIAVLAGALLLSAAMPAFAKKHHKHHHHHAQHSSQPAR
jgi:hypothetical protein